MTILWAAALILVLIASCGLTLLGLPGNWIMVAATSLYILLVPDDSRLSIHWPVAAALGILAALGELLEFLTGVFGVAKAGGSRRSATFCLVGSLVGGGVGLVVGLPIPIIGPVVSVVLLASLGALVGAILGEDRRNRPAGHRWRVGKAAFWGRMLGTSAKSLIGLIMAAVVLAALIIR